MITEEQKKKCADLYKAGRYTIKEIMSISGIRSEQTVYRILDSLGIPRRPSRVTAMKTTISMDEETAGIVKELKPKNLSEWICGLIKKYGRKAT